MTTARESLAQFIIAAEAALPHRFEIITEVGGVTIPTEALSEDHTLGLYVEAIPRKMRENAAGFREVEVADFVSQFVSESTPTGPRADWFLEYPPLRGVRFRAERLQYLEAGWWAVTREVKYPAATVLSLLHLMKAREGAVYMYMNTELPMPLWLRTRPMGEAIDTVQAVVQARGEGRVLLTNIHSECPFDFARQFMEAAQHYYRRAD